MLFVSETVKTEDLNTINNFFTNIENEFNPVVITEETPQETTVTKYISSLVSSQYAKSIEDIENTKIGNRIRKKKNLQQIMQESFFYGANRFGNNFIA